MLLKQKKVVKKAYKQVIFDTEIANLPSGGKYAPKFISFYNCSENNLSDELSNLDTSNITEMFYMFMDCSNLTSLDLSGFNTSNVTIMTDMFMGCINLTSLNISSFDTSNVTECLNYFLVVKV